MSQAKLLTGASAFVAMAVGMWGAGSGAALAQDASATEEDIVIHSPSGMPSDVSFA